MAELEAGLAGELDEVAKIMKQITSEDEACRISAATEIRRLTKTSSRNRRQLSGAVAPLVSMLRSLNSDSGEAAILALVNLAVKDESHPFLFSVEFVCPINTFAIGNQIQKQNQDCRSRSTRSPCSLLAIIEFYFAGVRHCSTPHPLGFLPQAKIDALTALYNLSTIPENLTVILPLHPVPALLCLLRNFRKSSKITEKCSALLELLVNFEEGRAALTAAEGGVLTIVEVLEEGSLRSREHAVGALLALCESDHNRYRDVILQEGAIPGLLQLTIQGTPKSRLKAHLLLQLLRSSRCKRSELQTGTLDSIVCNIVSNMDGDEQMGQAKKMLADMIEVSMEQSLRHLQQRAGRTQNGPPSC
ncbi:hypothetical protein ZIOFF_071724 [Zingiber officinale]|uniref:U-box domain-containing protein n=1 Tax=Zingiber officinale TaxID=94328 RepID=A0A8J5CA18_ZINOF|nr:hypothetical protein ZIOFF_071724 [Zingiber officinale]